MSFYTYMHIRKDRKHLWPEKVFLGQKQDAQHKGVNDYARIPRYF
jgi:hypothetical protein